MIRPAPWEFNIPKPDSYGDRTYFITERKDKGKETESFIDNELYYNSAPDHDDAKHIVKCVNMHKELVEALEYADRSLHLIGAFLTIHNEQGCPRELNDNANKIKKLLQRARWGEKNV